MSNKGAKNNIIVDTGRNKQFIATFMHPRDAVKFSAELEQMGITTKLYCDRVRFWTHSLTPDILSISDSIGSVTVKKV